RTEDSFMTLLDRREVLKAAHAAGLILPAGRIMAQDLSSIEEGAKKEGKVALATSVSVADFPKFLAAFTKKYPFLDVNSGLYQGSTGAVLSRVDAEVKSGSPTFDVVHAASLAAYLGSARA